MTETLNNTLQQEVEAELRQHPIMIYSKGTKDMPRCGFTMETIQFFQQFDVPFEMQDVLDNPEKRQFLSDMTDWPTLPKIFINGQFYGDTDILGPMAERGELQTLLNETFNQQN